jgi:hypothetical protein
MQPENDADILKGWLPCDGRMFTAEEIAILWRELWALFPSTERESIQDIIGYDS